MSDTIQIPLRARDGAIRAYATIDAVDAERVGPYRWCLHSQGYAFRNTRVGGRHGSQVGTFLHRFLLDAGPDEQVDHKNRDRLDCRRSNLRLTDGLTNGQNVSSRPGTSAYRGVSLHRSGRWRATVKHGGRQHSFGLHVTEELAAAAAAAGRAELLAGALD